MQMTLDELVSASGGRILSEHVREFCGVGTDTRTDLSGQVFIALKGENFDAHEFLGEAVKKGAGCLLVHRLPAQNKDLLKQVTVVEVDDTLLGLQRFGHYWRRKMTARILGLTGSNGKTTTKEFASSLISSRFKVHASKGSLNNHWGVPMSLLAISPADQVAVIEMGMNHLGELTSLSAIAEPDIVLVTMVGRGHLEGLGTIEGVAQAKAEIYQSAKADAVLCFNLDNSYTRAMFERFSLTRSKSKILTFSSSDPRADVSFRLLSMREESLRIGGNIAGEKGEAEIPVFGAQNLNNLMAAALLALAVGLRPDAIWQALPTCRTVWGRNQWVDLACGARVLFDGYNANPESMLAAVENFSMLKSDARKFAVLGEMKEMGAHAHQVHFALGEQAAKAGFAGICFLGPSGASFRAGLQLGGFKKSLFISDSYEQSLAPRLLPVLEVGDLVLMKGSRGMLFEKVLLDWQPINFHADH